LTSLEVLDNSSGKLFKTTKTGYTSLPSVLLTWGDPWKLVLY